MKKSRKTNGKQAKHQPYINDLNGEKRYFDVSKSYVDEICRLFGVPYYMVHPLGRMFENFPYEGTPVGFTFNLNDNEPVIDLKKGKDYEVINEDKNSVRDSSVSRTGNNGKLLSRPDGDV